jgi:hypothetical protein
MWITSAAYLAGPAASQASLALVRERGPQEATCQLALAHGIGRLAGEMFSPGGG